MTAYAVCSTALNSASHTKAASRKLAAGRAPSEVGWRSIVDSFAALGSREARKGVPRCVELERAAGALLKQARQLERRVGWPLESPPPGVEGAYWCKWAARAVQLAERETRRDSRVV